MQPIIAHFLTTNYANSLFEVVVTCQTYELPFADPCGVRNKTIEMFPQSPNLCLKTSSLPSRSCMRSRPRSVELVNDRIDCPCDAGAIPGTGMHSNYGQKCCMTTETTHRAIFRWLGPRLKDINLSGVAFPFLKIRWLDAPHGVSFPVTEDGI